MDDFRGYQALACDVLYRAVIDYQNAKKAGLRHKVEELEHFFTRSPAFFLWCDVAGLDPEAVRRQVLDRGV